MLVTQARYVAPDISGVSKSRVKEFLHHFVLAKIMKKIMKKMFKNDDDNNMLYYHFDALGK